ncbi:MAG: 50S ribosomal protein L29 [Candidatus Paceibacterota bacterium]|jgi:ribosomal protein L29
MKAKEISNKTNADLGKMLLEKREALRIFRFGASGAKTKNVKEGRAIRKDIARILTAMNSKVTL